MTANPSLDLPKTDDRTALLDFAVSRSPAIFYVADLVGDRPCRFVSANVESITGHRIEAFLSEARYGRRHIHPDDLPDYERNLERLPRVGKLAQQYRFRSADGRYHWYRDELRAAPSADGDASQFVGCMINIDAEVQAGQRLETTEAARRQLDVLLRDAVDSMQTGFYLTDRDDRLVVVNTVLAANADCSPEALIGQDLEALVRRVVPGIREFNGEPVEPSEDWIARITAHLRQRPAPRIELRLADGGWIMVTFHPTSEGGQASVALYITAHKQTQARLHDSERHFRLLIESHPLPVILADAETGAVLYESPASVELIGSGRDRPKPYNARDNYANPEDRARMIAEVRRRGAVYNWPLLCKRPDGTTFWAAVSSRMVHRDNRELMLSSLVDLSEQREREEALQRAHETLEDAIESLSEGFALFDAEDRLITCNSRYRDFNHVCADLLNPGMRFEDLVRTGAARGNYFGNAVEAEVEAWLEQHAANRYASFGGGFEYKQSDGRWVSYSNQPTRQGGMVVTLNDITRRKEMERALRDNEESVRTILESSPVQLTMIRARDAQILYESPVAQTIFQYDASMGYGSAAERWPNPRDRDVFIRRVRENGGAIDGYETVLQRRDGSTFACALSTRLIEYNGEEVMITSTFDLTERLAMEEQMERQREVLHQSEKMAALGELLASVAHELNNPLSVVVGQALLLQETAGDPKLAARAERIGSAADRCARVVKTFLAMARQQPQESRAVNVNELIEAAVEVTGYSLRSADVGVSIRLGRGLPAVKVDPDQLTQVFTNLIVNAEQALRQADGERRRDKKVWINTRYQRQSNEVVIKIKDNGPGIPEAIRRRIFEPFFTTKDVGSGTGIGLAICHRVLAGHGGKIKLEATPGGGATFVLRLPAMNGIEHAEAAEAASAEATEPLSVLVVDDEPDVADLLCEILEGDGHRAATARQGREALALIAGQDFDLVLSDLRMPDMDGPALFQALRQRHPAIAARTVFMTGDTLSEDVEAFLADCGRPHIEKPITPNDLRAVLRRHGRDARAGLD